jgi:hypothetical protein
MKQALLKCVSPRPVSPSLNLCLPKRPSLPDRLERARPREKGAPLGGGHAPGRRGAPLGEGRAQSCLIDWKGRALINRGVALLETY